jgi:hypothetical protein
LSNNKFLAEAREQRAENLLHRHVRCMSFGEESTWNVLEPRRDHRSEIDLFPALAVLWGRLRLSRLGYVKKLLIENSSVALSIRGHLRNSFLEVAPPPK